MRRREFVVFVGGALAAPWAVAQQPTAAVRLGVLARADIGLRGPFWKPFFDSLAERGWREGVDYVLVSKDARNDPAKLRAVAKELIALDVDIVLAPTSAAALAARQASGSVPIVTWCGYPVEAGLAASLARPGGKITGVANYAGLEIWGKFIELLRELRPDMGSLGILWDYAPPAFPESEALAAVPVIERAAKLMGMKSRTWWVRNERNLVEALPSIEREGVEALVVTAGGGIHGRQQSIARIGELIVRRRLPAIIPEILDRLASFVDRILRGANTGELPFEQPSRFDLAINRVAAKKIGLEIPKSILLRADRVIE
jgi:putative ABC transport system substrate-binding protein